ncbi:unnamed protein product [Scytosiphon promiscuus]
MSEDDWQDRQALLHANDKHKFVMDLGDGQVIDASQRGSILRFVNHSCGPNAETQKWSIQGKRRIGFPNSDTIEMLWKVTFNYCYVRYDEKALDCLCEHPNCVRTLGTKHGESDEKGESSKSEGRPQMGGSGDGGGYADLAPPGRCRERRKVHYPNHQQRRPPQCERPRGRGGESPIPQAQSAVGVPTPDSRAGPGGSGGNRGGGVGRERDRGVRAREPSEHDQGPHRGPPRRTKRLLTTQ